MPGWHEATSDLQADGSLQLAGIVLEQHPERARLFMQWKQMDWPLMVDSVNEMNLKAVPITLLLDEAGIVQAINPRRDDLEAFMARPPVEHGPIMGAPAPDFAAFRMTASATTDVNVKAEALRDLGDAQLRWGGTAFVNDAIDAYDEAIALRPDDGSLHFRRGVALRHRYEGPKAQPTDFADAVAAWRRALDLDPNQYIWRRRIQQFGPRLDKPYPFYDWVPTAREAILARGDTPVTLPVEPSGAEYAQPQRTFTSAEDVTPPAGAAEITRDDGFVRVRTVQVPSTSRRKPAVRVHVHFEPENGRSAHWNNEAEPFTLWLDEAPVGWRIDQRRFVVDNPATATSSERRTIEFEVERLDGAPAGPGKFTGFALFNVCEGADGVCLYRRLDFTVFVKE